MKNPTRRDALRLGLGAASLPLLARAASAASHGNSTVEISGMRFTPAEVRLAPGESVTFVNRDGASHTATGANGEFDTGRLTRGAEAKITFNVPGTYNYICAFHPSMRGVIVVS